MSRRGNRLLMMSLVVLLGLALLLPGCKAADTEKVLRMAVYNDVTTYDPPKIVVNPDWPIVLSVFNGLVRYVPGETTLEPDLAERYEVSDDGLTYTFYLRKGVQFHKGYGEFTAEDVKFSFERAADKETGSRYATQVKMIREIEIVDPYTVKFHMEAPYTDFLSAVVAFRPGLIVCKKAYEEMGDKAFGLNPIGTGAYVWDEHVIGVKVSFVANESYFRGRPAIDRVEVNVIPEETVTIMAMLNNEIDFTYLRTGEALDQALASSDLVVLSTPTLGSKTMWMNQSRAPYNDIRVRKALSYAINREELMNTVLRSQSTTEGMWAPIPPGVFGSLPNADELGYDYDPGEARRLIAEAGYEPGKLKVKVSFRQADRPVMEALQGYWTAVGIDATLDEMDNAGFAALEKSKDWEMMASGPTRTAPDQFMMYYESTNVTVFYGKIDSMIRAQRIETDQAKRLEILYDIQRNILENCVEFPVYRPLYITVSRKNVTGDVPNTHFWLWYWELMDIK